LERITKGDTDLIDYLQRVAGYALTGDVREHVFWFGFGAGGNGKSLLHLTFAGILNDYATTAPIEIFLSSQIDQHPTGIASLRGARLAVASEVPDGRRWNEARLKSLTGGDIIPARRMREDFFQFRPVFKLMIFGNQKPALSTVDEAIRRRLNVLPLNATIPVEERDPRLVEKLRGEWPAILRWMIDGCLGWQRNGLNPPQSVTAATESYLADEDSFGQWFEACCKAVRNGFVTVQVLFASWKKWCEQNEEFSGSKKRFGQKLEGLGYERGKERGLRGYRGLACTK
jgi:putative DNA primase/helicase